MPSLTAACPDKVVAYPIEGEHQRHCFINDVASPTTFLHQYGHHLVFLEPWCYLITMLRGRIVGQRSMTWVTSSNPKAAEQQPPSWHCLTIIRYQANDAFKAEQNPQATSYGTGVNYSFVAACAVRGNELVPSHSLHFGLGFYQDAATAPASTSRTHKTRP